MIRLGIFLGAKIETIIDISGTGDLVATSLSNHSRNRKFGREIAKQIIEKGAILSWTDKIYLRFKPEYVLEKMSNKLHFLVEGAYAIEPLIELAGKNNIPIPVYRSLYEVLLNKKEPSLLIETIKNPDNFENIYSNAKLHVKDKRKGLEKLMGKAFEKIIINQLVSKLTEENSLSNNSKNLKNIRKNESDKDLYFKNENKLFSEFLINNSKKSIKKLIRLYLRETIDRYNTFFYHLCVKFLSVKYYWYKLLRTGNNIAISGSFNEIYNLKDSVNTIYIAKSKNPNDFIYYMFAMYKNQLALPRFLVPADMLKSGFNKFIIRKCGGFIIYREKLNNMLYLESIIEYLSMLTKHGVPFIFFPELFTAEANNSDSNESFFNMLNNIMYDEATEIVLIPLEIAYKKKVNESEFRKVFTEPVSVNFSSPIFLSEFTRESNTEISIIDLVKRIWLLDEILLPHHIISGILVENDFTIKTSKLKKEIKKYITDNNIIIDRTEKSIINDGIKFLIKNEILARKDDHYIVLKQDLVKKFSDVVENKKSEP
jgi:1-acyl-sn-glycerol-3-phosphate acyltransferase